MAEKPVPLFDFAVPQAISTRFTRVTVRQLLVEEEQEATQLSKGNAADRIIRMVKTSLVEAEFEGKTLKLERSDGSVDSFFNSLDPKERELVLSAWNDVNSTTEDERQSFLKTKKVRV